MQGGFTTTLVYFGHPGWRSRTMNQSMANSYPVPSFE